jgi:hypothetical protein
MNDLDELLEEDGLILAIFSTAQDMVQELDGGEVARLLNIITGSSFALFQAIQSYKEIKNGKSIKHSKRITNSKNGSRLS